MPEQTNLARLLLNRFRWFDQALLIRLHDRLGVRLTSAQSLLFATLPVGGARQSDLARRLGVSRQAVNELVGGLEQQGLVEVVPDPDSGRAKLVRPTTQGRETIEVALGTSAQLEAELRARIGDRKVDQLGVAREAGWGEHPGGG